MELPGWLDKGLPVHQVFDYVVLDNLPVNLFQFVVEGYHQVPELGCTSDLVSQLDQLLLGFSQEQVGKQNGWTVVAFYHLYGQGYASVALGVIFYQFFF